MATDVPERSPNAGRLSGIRAAAILLAAGLLAAALFVPALRSGRVLFSGLDESAYGMLELSVLRGEPLVLHDDALETVPPDVRPDLFYRTGSTRPTRDLCRKLEPDGLSSRPFFHPVLAWQRARLPGLPAVLSVCLALLLARVVLRGTAAALPRRAGPVAAAAVAFAVLFLLPWGLRFAPGPFAEGPATLFVAFALAFAFAFGGPGAPASASFVPGLCLGLAVSFHPILVAWTIPVGLFCVLRNGTWRGTAALVLGAAVGAVPLVWTMAFVAAPYGNFLKPSELVFLVTQYTAIRLLAVAAAGVAAVGAALLVPAHLRRVRAAAAAPRARAALSAFCAAAVAAAFAFALVHPAARAALAADRDGVLAALPALAAALFLAFAWRRPAACALLAAGAVCSLPYLLVQGRETPVGLWSLRRSLAPLVAFFLAAFLAAFETDAAERDDPAAFRRRGRLRAGLLALAAACACAQLARIPAGALRGGETGCEDLLARMEARMDPDALHFFDYFPHAAPFAAVRPRRATFGLNEGAARLLGHDRAVGWLRRECESGRPVVAVSAARISAPLLENGIALVPDGDPVEGELSRFDGPTFRTASERVRKPVFSFLRVRPAARGDGTRLDFGESPFGLATGWDEPRRGKLGRWARQGATFRGPVPEPGGSVEFEIETAWTPPPGADWPERTLRLIPPWTAEPVELAVRADAGRHVLHATVPRPADDAADIPPSALWRLSSDRPYDPAAFGVSGYPPDLVVPVYGIRAEPVAPIR